MNDKKALIPMEEYEILKSIKADRETLKQELKEELLKECGTKVYNTTEEHNLKGLGYFGGYLATGAIIVSLISTNSKWYWYILPALSLMILNGSLLGLGE